MEHYRSTLATTAAAVFGLVAAAHVLHPGNYEPRVRPARAPVAEVAAAAVWVDPPAAPLKSPPAGRTTVADLRETSAVSGLLAPRAAAALPPGETMAPALPGEMIPQAERPRRAAAVPRRSVQRAVRTRQAALQAPVQAATAETRAAPGPESARSPASRIDPIGDLIRGLGLDG